MKNLIYMLLIWLLPFLALCCTQINYWISAVLIMLAFGLCILELKALAHGFFDKMLLFIQFLWVLCCSLLVILCYSMQSMIGWAG